MKSLDEYRDIAFRIHAVISSNQNHPDFRMGVLNSSCWDTLAHMLRQGFFDKPLFKSKKAWVRQIVIEDPKAFVFLVANIKIELFINGELHWWNGYGSEITRNPDSSIDFLNDIREPCLIEFLLGDNSKMFKGLLNDL